MKIWMALFLALSILLAGCGFATTRPPALSPAFSLPAGETIQLPGPVLHGSVSVEEALAQRRSGRTFSAVPLKMDEISQLLWAAQGITSADGGRTAPSAGALYPLEVYLAAGQVEGLSSGVYHYRPVGHSLLRTGADDVRLPLMLAAVGQSTVKEAPVSLVITAVYARTSLKYGDRGPLYVHLEAGHAAQNVCLQAAALGLNVVTIGAFTEALVTRTLNLPLDEVPLYIIPMGKRP